MTERQYARAGLVAVALCSAFAAACTDMADVERTQDICRAGIALITDQPVARLRVSGMEDGVVHLASGAREGAVAQPYKCRLLDERIIWGAESGIWRTRPSDPDVTFRVSEDAIRITGTLWDGTTRTRTYTRDELDR